MQQWHTHSRLANVISDYRSAFPGFLIGNQIAEYSRLALGLPRHGTCEQMHRFCAAAQPS
jgi:hypothetical protein